MAKLSKSIFQILDEMNQADCSDDKHRVSITLGCLGGDNTKKNGPVLKMCAPDGALKDLAFGKKMFMLLAVDADDFTKRQKECEIPG
jgi:hypothetical protein